MDRAMRKALILVLLMAFIGSVQAPSISVSPGILDLGEVERGTTEELYLYINPSDTGGPVQVTPRIEGPFSSTLFNNSEVSPSQVSQEDISPWINFQQESVVADPSETQTYTVSDGSTVNAAARIPVEISVPENAEPGFHAAKIGFGAERVGDKQGALGTSNWVLPFVQVTMEVPGQVERSVDLEDARAIRIGQNQAQIIAMLENTGTVTTEVEGGAINVLNEDDQKVGELNLGRATLTPSGEDQFQEVSMTWESSNLEPGTYQLDGTGDFITGRFYLGDQISIQSAIQDTVEVEDPTDVEEDSPGSGLPPWLIVMIIMLLGVIMYSFDIDPLWIVLIIGIISISAFVLMTGLPLYLIAITLILGVLMIYYGLI